MADTIEIDGRALSVEDVAAVAKGLASVALSERARSAVEASRQAARAHDEAGRVIYGMTTGAGALDSKAVESSRRGRHQLQLLRSHAAGVGAPLPDEVVRATMLVRANALAGGFSAVRLELIEQLALLLNRGVTPLVPEAGSVGASDLAQLSHIGLVLVGEGRARFRGELMPAKEALLRAEIRPIVLEGREGFAIFNGLAFSVGLGALVVSDADRIREVFELACGLGAHAVGAVDSSFEAVSVRTRAHPGPIASAEALRSMIRPTEGLREYISTRTAHQALGALREANLRAREVVEREINTPSDNPMIGGDGYLNNNAANFDGSVLGQALDLLATSVIAACTQSERRTARLFDDHHNGDLPAFLLHPNAGATETGMMLAQYSAASLVAEMRAMGLPASIMSMPTSEREDWSSMCTLAARRAEWILERAKTVAAIELVVSAQAADLSGGSVPAPLRPCYEALREKIPVWVEDRILGDDIAAAVDLVCSHPW